MPAPEQGMNRTNVAALITSRCRSPVAGAPLPVPHPRMVEAGCLSAEVSKKRGWREGVGDKQTLKESQKSSPEMCPPSPKAKGA